MSTQLPKREKSHHALHKVIVGKKTVMSMMIPLKLNDSKVQGSIDTEAQTTVMIEEF